MNKFTELLTDDYNFETLVVPVSSLVLPCGVTAAALGYGVSNLLGTIALGIEIVVFPLWILANSIREHGKELEAKYLGKNMPTTRMLRLREPDGNYSKKALRKLLEDKSGVKLLNARQERDNPERADQIIERAVNIAKEQMRDANKFRLLRRELKAYGYWRNMLSIRETGIKVSALLSILSTGILLWRLLVHHQTPVLLFVAIALSLLSWYFWATQVTYKKYIDVAYRYAAQFYKSLETI